jgi:16S rRNA (adenine1518-N6/adenine1519-N6)-dimethyltransferase
MNLFRPTELHAFLRELDKKPSKRLSQNFLVDGNILRKIITCSAVEKDDIVIEVGSGPGVLTQALLEKGVHLLAIEKDPLFARALVRLQTKDNRLQVIEDDVLTLPLEQLFKNKEKKIKLVSNLPYQITTPFLARLCPLHTLIESMTLMIQKEVALRLIAKRGTAEYSSFTLFLEYYAQTSYCFTVAPSCFYPVPKVSSALVHLTLKPPSPFPFPEKFIRAAFQKRRKMLRSSLKGLYPSEKIQTAFDSLGISSAARPENLSLDDFHKLHDHLEL